MDPSGTEPGTAGARVSSGTAAGRRAAPHQVLIIEDDPDIARLLQMHVARLAGSVRVENHGTRGLMLALARRWDLLLIDWLLPGTDGVEICRRLRNAGRTDRIILLTARTGELDRVTGLDGGADDYIAKPFSLMELLARVRAQLRRVDAAPSEASAAPVQVGGLRVEPAARGASLDGRNISLTAREFDLLYYFAQRPGQVLTRDQLLAGVWGAGFDGYAHTVNSHINRLRAKLEPEPATPRLLVTVWGAGYRLDAPGTSGIRT